MKEFQIYLKNFKSKFTELIEPRLGLKNLITKSMNYWYACQQKQKKMKLKLLKNMSSAIFNKAYKKK